jgi:hypothetical protein
MASFSGTNTIPKFKIDGSIFLSKVRKIQSVFGFGEKDDQQ